MDIGKVIEIGKRKVEVPALEPVRVAPEREPEREPVREPEKVDA